jgi:hypothetical protein
MKHLKYSLSFFQRKFRFGFTLAETLIALVVMTTIMSGILLYFSSLMETRKQSLMQRDVMGIADLQAEGATHGIQTGTANNRFGEANSGITNTAGDQLVVQSTAAQIAGASYAVGSIDVIPLRYDLTGLQGVNATQTRLSTQAIGITIGQGLTAQTAITFKDLELQLKLSANLLYPETEDDDGIVPVPIPTAYDGVDANEDLAWPTPSIVLDVKQTNPFRTTPEYVLVYNFNGNEPSVTYDEGTHNIVSYGVGCYAITGSFDLLSQAVGGTQIMDLADSIDDPVTLNIRVKAFPIQDNSGVVASEPLLISVPITKVSPTVAQTRTGTDSGAITIADVLPQIPSIYNLLNEEDEKRSVTPNQLKLTVTDMPAALMSSFLYSNDFSYRDNGVDIRVDLGVSGTLTTPIVFDVPANNLPSSSFAWNTTIELVSGFSSSFARLINVPTGISKAMTVVPISTTNGNFVLTTDAVTEPDANHYYKDEMSLELTADFGTWSPIPGVPAENFFTGSYRYQFDTTDVTTTIPLNSSVSFGGIVLEGDTVSLNGTVMVKSDIPPVFQSNNPLPTVDYTRYIYLNPDVTIASATTSVPWLNEKSSIADRTVLLDAPKDINWSAGIVLYLESQVTKALANMDAFDIYYTLDGSEPSATSSTSFQMADPATGTLHLDNILDRITDAVSNEAVLSKVLKVKAIRKASEYGYRDSDTVSIDLDITKIKPNLTISRHFDTDKDKIKLEDVLPGVAGTPVSVINALTVDNDVSNYFEITYTDQNGDAIPDPLDDKYIVLTRFRGKYSDGTFSVWRNAARKANGALTITPALVAGHEDVKKSIAFYPKVTDLVEDDMQWGGVFNSSHYLIQEVGNKNLTLEKVKISVPADLKVELVTEPAALDQPVAGGDNYYSDTLKVTVKTENYDTWNPVAGVPTNDLFPILFTEDNSEPATSATAVGYTVPIVFPEPMATEPVYVYDGTSKTIKAEIVPSSYIPAEFLDTTVSLPKVDETFTKYISLRPFQVRMNGNNDNTETSLWNNVVPSVADTSLSDPVVPVAASIDLNTARLDWANTGAYLELESMIENTAAIAGTTSGKFKIYYTLDDSDPDPVGNAVNTYELAFERDVSGKHYFSDNFFDVLKTISSSSTDKTIYKRIKIKAIPASGVVGYLSSKTIPIDLTITKIDPSLAFTVGRTDPANPTATTVGLKDVLKSVTTSIPQTYLDGVVSNGLQISLKDQTAILDPADPDNGKNANIRAVRALDALKDDLDITYKLGGVSKITEDAFLSDLLDNSEDGVQTFAIPPSDFATGSSKWEWDVVSNSYLVLSHHSEVDLTVQKSILPAVTIAPDTGTTFVNNLSVTLDPDLTTSQTVIPTIPDSYFTTIRYTEDNTAVTANSGKEYLSAAFTSGDSVAFSNYLYIRANAFNKISDFKNFVTLNAETTASYRKYLKAADYEWNYYSSSNQSSSDSNYFWNTKSSWIPNTAYPNQKDLAVLMGDKIRKNRTVYVNGSYTIGNLYFDNTYSSSYTLAQKSSGNKLIFEKTTGRSELVVINGSHTLTVPLQLNRDLTVNVLNDNESISFSTGAQVSKATNSYYGVIKTGPGTLMLATAGTGNIEYLINEGAVTYSSSSNRIETGAKLTLNGGRLELVGYSQTLSVPTYVTAASTLDFGTGDISGQKADFSELLVTEGALLTVKGWKANVEKLQSQTYPGLITLSRIQFDGYAVGSYWDSSTKEIRPIQTTTSTGIAYLYVTAESIIDMGGSGGRFEVECVTHVDGSYVLKVYNWSSNSNNKFYSITKPSDCDSSNKTARIKFYRDSGSNLYRSGGTTYTKAIWNSGTKEITPSN